LLAGDLPRGGASPEFANVGAPGVLGGRDRAGERDWTAGNSSKGLGRLIRVRVRDLHDGAARGNGGKWGAHVQRGIGGKKGHGALLTSPGYCDGGWRPRIEAPVLNCGGARRRSYPRVVQRSGGARAQRGSGGGGCG
jgi:hypothetical protein